ncbi:MAG: potassium transporter Kup [Pseudomonadota bacterium]|jgi:KUP system potassium uptake protein
MIAALGVVFGDIGTSPLYAMRECFHGAHSIPLTQDNVFGVLSMMCWSIAMVVALKYVIFIMRADNQGEGGILALLALTKENRKPNQNRAWQRTLMTMGVIGAALFYGDSMITPAISVLSAVEGLEVIAPFFEPYVLPITVIILIGLFAVQPFGTSKVGAFFGPVMLLWFSTLGILGFFQAIQYPTIFAAISPHYALEFIITSPLIAFLVLGAVFLTVTGAEALYADMGHFGRPPIQKAWFLVVMPALLMNYFGQGALILTHEKFASDPFYHLAPAWGLPFLVLLATAATVIASQAVISGAFSMTLQATRLGFAPRFQIVHTSEGEQGQIYIPRINWFLLAAVLSLVFIFKTSNNLSSAYGIAVATTMVIDTILAFNILQLFCKNKFACFFSRGLFILFLCIDVAFFSANTTKILDGGWFPILMASALFMLMISWKKGRTILAYKLRSEWTVKDFVENVAVNVPRVDGIAIFMTADPDSIPHSLIHNLKHNKVLHEKIVIFTVKTENVPYLLNDQERLHITELGGGFYKMTMHYGFKERPNLGEDLPRLGLDAGLEFNMMETTFFLSRETLVYAKKSVLPFWMRKLFILMSRNAASPMEFFQIPNNRVVEIGEQVAV